MKVFAGFAITGFVVYLYWSTFRAKWKLRYLVMDSHTPSNTSNTFYAQMKKDKSMIHLSITQLLITIFSGILRITRVVFVVTAEYHRAGFLREKFS